MLPYTETLSMLFTQFTLQFQIIKFHADKPLKKQVYHMISYDKLGYHMINNINMVMMIDMIRMIKMIEVIELINILWSIWMKFSIDDKDVKDD